MGHSVHEVETRRGRKAVEHASLHVIGSNIRSNLMKWETPQASDMRYGFEITMYIATR
jgi:coenzyme PQQ precursor peptide PqqA